MELKRYELHSTHAGSYLRPHPEGEIVMYDDVESILNRSGSTVTVLGVDLSLKDIAAVFERTETIEITYKQGATVVVKRQYKDDGGWVVHTVDQIRQAAADLRAAWESFDKQ